MNYNYAEGFSTSSKKKKKIKSSVTIGRDIIGCRNYTDCAVMEMNNASEESTQIMSIPNATIDLSGNDSQDYSGEYDPNLSAFCGTPPHSKATTAKEFIDRPVTGSWLTKRSSSSSSTTSSSTINTRWSRGKAYKRKAVAVEKSSLFPASRNKSEKGNTSSSKKHKPIKYYNLNSSDSDEPEPACKWTRKWIGTMEDAYTKDSGDEYSTVSYHPITSLSPNMESSALDKHQTTSPFPDKETSSATITALDKQTTLTHKQTTLTQYVRSLDTPLKKNRGKQTTLSQFVTPLKTPNQKKKILKSTNKFVSRNPEYGVEWRDAMPGDLVMAFASDIKHPAVDEGLIHRNYILVGIVKVFVYVEWNTHLGDDEWNGITTQERLKVFWSDIDGWDSYSSNQPKHPLNSQVKVIALKRNGNLDGINPQFKALIEDQFGFVRGGWTFNQYFS